MFVGDTRGQQNYETDRPQKGPFLSSFSEGKGRNSVRKYGSWKYFARVQDMQVIYSVSIDKEYPPPSGKAPQTAKRRAKKQRIYKTSTIPPAYGYDSNNSVTTKPIQRDAFGKDRVTALPYLEN